jgi:probable rRNA maturation factor
MIEINNLTNFAVDEKSFSQVAKKVLSGENRGTENISLAIVGKEEIKKLNKEFRNKNKSTDVLSFNFEDERYLGEVVICPDMVKEKGEEMMDVFIHGILHLLGYDHEKSEKEAEEMEQKQEKYLSKVK